MPGSYSAPGGGGGGSSAPIAREQIAVPTANLAASASENVTVTVAAGWRAFGLQTNRPARVRVYRTTAQRTADAARAAGTDPTGDHGVLLDFVTTSGDLDWTLSPAIDMHSGDASSEFPAAVTNLDVVAGAVIATFDYVRTE